MSRTIRVAACDLNGQARGKRLPESYATKLDGAVRLPFSALNLDIFGADIENSPLVFESGDADGALQPTDRGPVPMPWLQGAPMFYPMTLVENGVPWPGDPRGALINVLDRFAARGWRVMAATELEFYLLDTSDRQVRAPLLPGTDTRLSGDEILSLQLLDGFDAFFSDLYANAAAMGLPAQAAIAEGGVGQFEVNLNHQDALRAADDTWLFKMLVKGVAHAHGLTASFAAKPFPAQAGNGLHVHFSIIDRDGNNVFDDGSDTGNDTLRHAVGGLLATMRDQTLIFAPHANSFARFTPGSHAPTALCWAYENRTASIRIPGGSPKARRIEHRVAGGDTNPYLMLAAILGGAMNGIDDAINPPPPITGNAYAQDLPQMAGSWVEAIDFFADSPFTTRIFAPLLIDNLVRTKRQEFSQLGEATFDVQLGAVLSRV
ncbi:glutamine synthetase [Actibacterium mucosum KCTC 23349]|uniref:Glutamine synthetase n=1 Tax=Actibacterium mucosum KCTC 23349 TaxID=1454373 RepID=A0A037ZH67_9RHOB|nr:glutamine synthetase family protein [Actibacterium mucosum]KAJ54165.1 glutamine synthetase [Actibacterium mucosum KCTC 23349]